MRKQEGEKQMKIELSDHFTVGRMLRFSFPSIIMMIFTSIYTVVDGLFVAHFVGSNSLSAISIVMPMMNVVGAFGFMLGTGGSAEVARKLGEGNEKTAHKYFSSLLAAVAVIGISLAALCIVFMRPLCYWLGASELLIEDCIVYGTLCMAGIVFFMLQCFFQSFFVVAQKPEMGLILTVCSGVTNMFLDWLFIAALGWGIAGAAIATACGYIVGSVIPLVYFLRPNKSLLHLVRPQFDRCMLARSAVNGSSEMVSNISMAVTTFLYNIQLMRMVGEDGVAAITIMSYVNFIFVSVFLGFAIGSAPVVSYHYGAGNHKELRSLFKNNVKIILVLSVLLLAGSELGAVQIVSVFAGNNQYLYEMALEGFRLFALAFLVCGVNIFASSFFTALCNGKVSAIISFMRTLVFQVSAILLMPLLWQLRGVWLALPAAEVISAVLSVSFLIYYRKVYHY